MTEPARQRLRHAPRRAHSTPDPDEIPPPEPEHIPQEVPQPTPPPVQEPDRPHVPIKACASTSG